MILNYIVWGMQHRWHVFVIVVWLSEGNKITKINIRSLLHDHKVGRSIIVKSILDKRRKKSQVSFQCVECRVRELPRPMDWRNFSSQLFSVPDELRHFTRAVVGKYGGMLCWYLVDSTILFMAIENIIYGNLKGGGLESSGQRLIS